MSYDIRLLDPVTKETIQFENPHFMRGGTYAMYGTTEAWLNITYNYSRWYYKAEVFGRPSGICTIYGLTGAESIPVLRKAIAGLESLNEDLSDKERRECLVHDVSGYWLPTRENAIKPLYQLLAMAQMRPDGVWSGD